MIPDPAGLERFRREAQLAARATHPNIVSIYDIGGRSGLYWYTMELVSGPNVAQLVDQEGPLPLERVLWLLREALGALAYAHSSGLVHRDIKPENILVSTSGGLKITDFGLALALRGQGKFGGASSRSGTPHFASPEQLLGDKIDVRTDLYSLAAVAYFALLGYPPFAGNRPEVVLAKQTTNQLPNLVGERPAVGPEFANVLRLALQADRNARYPTASEFLQALNRAARRDLRAQAGPGWLKAVRRWLRPPSNRPPS